MWVKLKRVQIIGTLFIFKKINKMIILTIYPDTLTDSETMFCIIFFLVMVMLYFFRHVPIIGILLKIVIMFFLVLFATLFINYAKKEIKEWWSK